MEELINSKKNSKQPFVKYSRSQWCDKHQKVVEKNQKLTNEVQDLKEKARQNKKALEKEKDKKYDNGEIRARCITEGFKKFSRFAQESRVFCSCTRASERSVTEPLESATKS